MSTNRLQVKNYFQISSRECDGIKQSVASYRATEAGQCRKKKESYKKSLSLKIDRRQLLVEVSSMQWDTCISLLHVIHLPVGYCQWHPSKSPMTILNMGQTCYCTSVLQLWCPSCLSGDNFQLQRKFVVYSWLSLCWVLSSIFIS